jgi:hypothetical protein
MLTTSNAISPLATPQLLAPRLIVEDGVVIVARAADPKPPRLSVSDGVVTVS